MADEATPTPTSDQTLASDAPQDAPAIVVADKPVDAPADKAVDAPADDNSTALGGEADAPADKEAGEATVPETYELTAPEGFEKLDPEALALATPVFKELGLSNEQADKLMPVAGEFAKKIIAERDAQFLGSIAEQRKEWLETAQKDPEIGGAKWDASLQDSARALDHLGFPAGSPLRALLNESGLGNHPEMIRLMSKVGKAIGEDNDFVRADHNASVKKTDAELFYGAKS